MPPSVLTRLRQAFVEAPPRYDPELRTRSRLLSLFLLVMMAVFVAVDLIYVLTVPGYAVPWYGYGFLLAALGLNRLGFYPLSAALVAIMFPAVVFSSVLTGLTHIPAVMLGFLTAGLILTSILLSYEGVLLYALLNGLGILLLPRLAAESFPDIGSIVSPLAILVISAVLIIVAMRSRDRLESDRQALLQRSEERYRMLFEEAPDGILIISPEGRIVMANAVMYRMTGYTPEQVVGRRPEEFVAPEDIARRPIRPYDQLHAAGVSQRERVILRRDGSRLDVLVGSSFMPDGHLQLIIQDITARRNVENALRASEEKFAKAFQSSPDAVTLSFTSTGKFLDINDGFCQMSGYTRAEALGCSAEELGIWVEPQDRRRMVGILEQDGRVRDFETRLRRKSGELLHCLLSVEPMEINGEACMVVITRDITVQKRMELDLRLSEERYRLVSSVISDYTFFTRVDEHGRRHVAWIAGAFETISGYSIPEYIARGGWPATVHPDDLWRDRRDMQLLERNQRITSELRILRKDGSVAWVRVYAHPMWDETANRLAGIYGAVQDINLQKGIEQERETLIRELEAKNAELEQFTYMVSHDLKAPLITIKGFLGFLARDAASGDQQRLQADLGRISEATDKMHRLLNDLLDLSRVGRIMNDPEPVDLNFLVPEVTKLLQGRFEQQGARLQVAGRLPVVYGDRHRLLEVFQNLADNACKFMGSQPDPRIEVGQQPPSVEGFVTLYVRDNGVGIAPQFHERIFGLFNRLDPGVEGTGVGLALVKRIVELHGGRIWVESEVGQGATFFFTLPVPHTG